MDTVTKSLGFEIKFAPTDYLHVLNEQQKQECFNWLNNNHHQRMNDWPGWKLLNLPH